MRLSTKSLGFYFPFGPKKRTRPSSSSSMFLGGFEPPAFRLGGGRSILLSYRNNNHEAYIIIAVHKGQGKLSVDRT